MEGIFWTTANLDAAGEPLPQIVVSRHDYLLDSLGRRTGVVREDGRQWEKETR